MISDEEAMAEARPLTPPERHAYLARVFAGDLPRRVRVAAQLRADDAQRKTPAGGSNLNDIPSTALVQTLVGQIRRTILLIAVFGAGEVGGAFLGQRKFSALLATLDVVADLSILLIGSFVVYLWFDRRRWLLALIFLIACCHGYFLTGR